MENNKVEFNGNQIIIAGQKSALAIRLTLIAVLIICVLIPIAATIAILAERKGLHVSIFLAFLFFWGIGFYMLRMILWNTFGREIVTLGKDTINYEADFRFFRDGKTSLSTKGIEATVIPADGKNVNLATLIFSTENQQFSTVLQAPAPQLLEIATAVNIKYQ